MKRYSGIIKNSFLVLVVLCGWSCESYFELDRPTPPPWQSPKELEMVVREGYMQFTTSDPWQTPLGALVLIHFGQSDIARVLDDRLVGNNGSLLYYNWGFGGKEPTGFEVEWCFKHLYRAITAENAGLKLLADAEARGEDPFVGMLAADRDFVKRLKGEMYFLRGLAYYYLARIYAPPFNPEGTGNDKRYFVLRTEYVNQSEELKNGKLGSVAEVWKQIEDDFKAAKELLPESYVAAPEGKGRANKWAASGMLCKTYFITGRHDLAKAECDAIIGSGRYDLSEDPLRAFARVGDQDAKEVIWEFRYDASSDRFTRTWGILGKNVYNGVRTQAYSIYIIAYSTLMKIGWMATNMSETDEARSDKRYQQVYMRYEAGKDPLAVVAAAYPYPAVWLDKYFNGGSHTSAQRRATVPMIRVAETYLTRAIILFRAGDKPGAAADVNLVRARAGLDPIDPTVLTENDIHNERIKELSGETDDRNYYLIGLRMPLGIGDRDATKFTPIQPPYSNYYWNVPLQEREQNQAYH